MSERKIKGTILCHCRDEYGEIAVADDDATRSIYFGEILQSSIRLDRPETLVGEYNHAMMTALLLRDSPQSVLLIGLGGCSLLNFLLRYFPECAIDVVEIRQKVIDLAREFFLLPAERANLKIFHAPGQEFIGREEGGCATYDLILVDAFDEDGPAVSLLQKDFLTACRKRLSANGVFAMNLWNRPRDNFPGTYARLRESFGNNALKLSPAEAYQNTIVFGFDSPPLVRDLPRYRRSAKKLEQKYGINFQKYLKYLYWQNFSG